MSVSLATVAIAASGAAAATSIVSGTSVKSVTPTVATPTVATPKPATKKAPVVREPQSITIVGTRTVSAARTRHPSGKLPAHTQRGDLVVTYAAIQNGQSVHARCQGNARRAVDIARGNRGRLLACWRIVGASRQAPTPVLNKSQSVATVTVAFRGVDSAHPVDAAAGRVGAHIHAGGAFRSSDTVVLGEAGAWPARAPHGSTLIARVRSHHAAVGVALVNPRTSAFNSTWHAHAAARTVLNAVLALRPSKTVTYFRNVSIIGTPVTDTAGQTSTFTTAFPAGTAYGDVLVSWVETYESSSVTCPKGWTHSLDAHSADKAIHMVACVSVANPQRPPGATITPAAQASIVTTAYRGVSTSSPIDKKRSSSSLTTPSVTTTIPGETLALGEGSSSLRAVAVAPQPARVAASINNGSNSQVATATATAASVGATPTYTWSTSPRNGSTVAAVLALRNAPRSSRPSKPVRLPKSTPTSTPTPTPTTSTPTSTPTPTPTTSTPTSTPTPTPTTSTPTSTPTPTPTTSTPTSTPTPTPTTSTPTSTPTPTPTTSTPTSTPTPTPTTSSLPPASATVVCGTGQLTGPSTAPAGSVIIPAGDDSGTVIAQNWTILPNTTYYFATGVHSLGSSQFSQIQQQYVYV